MITIQQEKKRIQQLIKLDEQSDEESNSYYKEALDYIRNHLLLFYEHYSDENNLSIKQTSARVSQWDLAQWKKVINELDMSGWPDEARKRVKTQSIMAGIDRTSMMNAIIAIALITATVKHYKAVKKRIEQDGATEVQRMIKAFKLSRSNKKIIKSIVKNASQEWSKEIWINNDVLVADVSKTVYSHLIKGMPLSDLQDMLTTHINKKQFKPKQSLGDRIKQSQFDTKRLIRSESARVKDQVNTAAFEAVGIKKVNWVTEPGACNKCIGIESQGPYQLDDAPSIPGDSHPQCRCSKVPVEED